MKNLSRKLMLSIMAIALVVIALGTSTFAWFTLSNKASVGQFNAEVTAGEGMELSLDQSNWYSVIPSTVIQAKIKSDFEAAATPNPANLNTTNKPILTAVSADKELVFKKIAADQSGYVAASANVDYIKIKIYVRAVNLNTVKVDSITVTGTPIDWTPDASFDGADGNPVTPATDINVSAANGARVAINATSGDYTIPFVFENAGTSSAPTNTVLGGIDPITTGLELPANGQAAYFYEKNSINPNTIISGLPGSVIATQTDVVTPAQIITLTDGTGYNTGNFDLFVWFEGFDPDTYDAILKMPLNISMSFVGSLVE